VKGSYDPIHIVGSYKRFFSDSEKMLKKEGSYLNKKVVMSFIGTPFSSLLKSMNEEEEPASPKEIVP
jgi:cyclopropane fatty-acyl-phospholipid synthase-like methyltransferase